MSKPATQAERLATLEANDGHTRDALGAIVNQLKDLEKHIDGRFDKLETRLTTQETKLAGYENKGAGILIGVGLLGTGLGAAILTVLAKALEWFK
jgi:predicted RNase H-like nuclease (RuvC/YqgF family)